MLPEETERKQKILTELQQADYFRLCRLWFPTVGVNCFDLLWSNNLVTIARKTRINIGKHNIICSSLVVKSIPIGALYTRYTVDLKSNTLCHRNVTGTKFTLAITGRLPQWGQNQLSLTTSAASASRKCNAEEIVPLFVCIDRDVVCWSLGSIVHSP